MGGEDGPEPWIGRCAVEGFGGQAGESGIAVEQLGGIGVRVGMLSPLPVRSRS